MFLPFLERKKKRREKIFTTQKLLLHELGIFPHIIRIIISIKSFTCVKAYKYLSFKILNDNRMV